mgnify:CR=1 FL=1
MFSIFNSETDNYGNIDVIEFSNLVKNENHVVIDVRTPQEKADGDIPGSQLINLFDPSFAQNIDALDRDKTYIVFCRSGNRSKSACSLMAKKGFEKLYNLKGGIFGWNQYQAQLKNA